MSNIAAASVQSAAYTTERTKQEANELGNTANTTASETQDDFQSKVDAAANQARVKKEEAVAEGKADVEHAKAATASYLDQARDLVGVALDKAQTYVSAGQERLGATTTHSTAHVRNTGSEGPRAGGLTTALTDAAVSALQTTKGVLATAQAHLGATGQTAQPKHHSESPHPTTPSYTDAAKQPSENAQAVIQPHAEAPKPPLPSSTVDTSTTSAPSISSTAATAGSTTSTETPSASSQIASPATISYPKEPKTEAHHITTEGGAAPPEKADDKAINKLADGLTSTKITDVNPATSTH